jgi:GntR family histidine utilization transcriptional repressor
LNEHPRLSWTDVRNRIRARILDRTYAPGDRLPRDEDIARDLGCARATVHRAMQDLAQIGLVARRRKGGTHVLRDPVTRTTVDIPVTRREVEARGATYGYRLIDRRLAPAPDTVLARFGLDRPVEMLQVRALHLADERPFICEDRWIDIRATPEILDVDLSRDSANEWLVRNKPYSRVEVRFSAIDAPPETARHLGTESGRAVFVIERTTWIDDAPITTVQGFAAPGYQLVTQG